MANKFDKLFVSTSIPYVNGAPHIGHAVESIQVDAIARYYRQQLGAANVFALTGSDENSLKNVQAAEAAGEQIDSFVAKNAKAFSDLDTALDFKFDDFIRTREERHMVGAQKLWSACKPEDIYKKSYTGLYCVGCETFYTEKDVPDGICPTHKKPLEKIEEENYFFKLSNYQAAIEDLIASDKLRIFPANRKNEILNFVRGGLEDFSISRSQARAKHWGVNVPGDDSQVMYVWFDALSNYITALGYGAGDQNYDDFWANEAARKLHVIGKDIIRFHAVYWPAMLMSANLPLPTDLFVHGFFTVEGEKMSKSIGNVINPHDLIAEFGVDALRYYLLSELPYDDDGDVSRERMEIRFAELANQLGNLVSRVATMAVKNFEGVLSDVVPDLATVTESQLVTQMENCDLRGYIHTIFIEIMAANLLIQTTEPFKLVKVDVEAARAVLAQLKARILWAARALAPIMPEASAKIIAQYSPVITIADGLFPRRDTK